MKGGDFVDIDRIEAAVNVICEEIRTFTAITDATFESLRRAFEQLKQILQADAKRGSSGIHINHAWSWGERSYSEIWIIIISEEEHDMSDCHIFSRGKFQKGKICFSDGFFGPRGTRGPSSIEEFEAALKRLVEEKISRMNEYSQNLDRVADCLVNLMEGVKSVRLTS